MWARSSPAVDLPGQHGRLLALPAQAALLSEYTGSQGPRSIYEHARDVARSLARTTAFGQSRHDRKRIEMRFAHLKRILRLGRLRLRGPRGAQDEFILAATAQNLRRLAKLASDPGYCAPAAAA